MAKISPGLDSSCSLPETHSSSIGSLGLLADLSNSHLAIKDVKAAGQALRWDLGKRMEPYGSPLTIQAPSAESGDVELDVRRVFCHFLDQCLQGLDFSFYDKRLYRSAVDDTGANIQQETPVHV